MKKKSTYMPSGIFEAKDFLVRQQLTYKAKHLLCSFFLPKASKWFFIFFSNAKKVKLGKIQKMSEKNHKKLKEKKIKG